MTDCGKQDSASPSRTTSTTSADASKKSETLSGSVVTSYGGTVFRSRLEACWAGLFDISGIEWEYEPKAKFAGWWPDFLVHGIKVEDKAYSVYAEVKPVAFCPTIVDDSFGKALHDRWTMMLGSQPSGDYVGFLACKRNDDVLTIPLILTDDGIEASTLQRENRYGGHAEATFRYIANGLRSPRLGAAILASLATLKDANGNPIRQGK